MAGSCATHARTHIHTRLTHCTDDLPVKILSFVHVLEVNSIELLGGCNGHLHEPLATLGEVELGLLSQRVLSSLQRQRQN